MKNFLKNYLTTSSFILLVYYMYTHIPFYQNFLYSDMNFEFNDFNLTSTVLFKFVIGIYLVLLIPYYVRYKEKSKARLIFGYIKRQTRDLDSKISYPEKNAILAWIVKIFFAPLMIFWLSGHIFQLTNNLYLASNNLEYASLDFLYFFNQWFFWTAFTFILFSDVLFFTLGYLIETPFLKNKIKSVEPTLIGWAVALICYPPFNTYLSNLIGWYSTDFPSFDNPTVHLIMNFSILILMGIYSWASVSLGFKASNLTNRGIVRKGPYRLIRHPAYISKNLSWRIGGLPLIIIAISSNNFGELLSILIGLTGWSFIYYLRAVTEERHLSRDPDYLEYKKKVKYKFIPGLW